MDSFNFGSLRLKYFFPVRRFGTTSTRYSSWRSWQLWNSKL